MNESHADGDVWTTNIAVWSVARENTETDRQTDRQQQLPTNDTMTFNSQKYQHLDCRSWGLGVLTPWKYVGEVRVSFDPPKMSHSYVQTCCLITLQVFRSSTMKDLHQKWKVKLTFRGAWNSLTAWPDWPWPPPHTLRQIYAIDQHSRRTVMSYVHTRQSKLLNIRSLTLHKSTHITHWLKRCRVQNKMSTEDVWKLLDQ